MPKKDFGLDGVGRGSALKPYEQPVQVSDSNHINCTIAWSEEARRSRPPTVTLGIGRLSGGY